MQRNKYSLVVSNNERNESYDNGAGCSADLETKKTKLEETLDGTRRFLTENKIFAQSSVLGICIFKLYSFLAS